MKMVAVGTYSDEGKAALADSTYDNRRVAMDTLLGSMGGKVIDYFFCDGDNDFVIVADVPSREVGIGARNNAYATGSLHDMVIWFEIDLAKLTAHQRSARKVFKPITE